VHWPEAQAKPLEPHDLPLGATISVGQVDEVPVQYSAGSQVTFLEALQTSVEGAKLHWEVQHALENGSHCAPLVNLHVAESQHGDVTSEPGSHSSPSSTIPFPHICRERRVRVLEEASTRHEAFVWPLELEPVPLIREQMLPRVQGLKVFSLEADIGFMMNCELASQVDELKGQHTVLELQPSVQS